MNLIAIPSATRRRLLACAISMAGCLALPAWSQVGPSPQELAGYTGLHAAAHRGDVKKIEKLVAAGSPVNARDAHGRTPLHVAAFARQSDAIRALANAGANLDLLDSDRYDAVTIVAVADDEETLKALLTLGASAKPAHPGRRAAGPREQPALDGGDRVHRSRRRRPPTSGDPEGAD